MFSKLLKYELKSVGKWYFALNALIIAISFFL
ncbi:MAG: ABC transporter permease, partial [Streptococcus sp.]|nr:ABC transporter permease [Streptococcus sp.]